MRKLAHIEKIEWKRPIEGADRIELVGVLGWQCISKKDEFQVGDLCVYIEIDSIVDSDNPNFAFLEKRNYKIKTLKMKGVISQGVVFPLTILPNGKCYMIGDDVTSTLKITQIEDEIPKSRTVNPPRPIKLRHKKLFKSKAFMWLMKHHWFRKTAIKILTLRKKPKQFPEWIVKTDEVRLQNMPFVLGEYKDKPMIVTEKLDGTSSSYGLRKVGLRRYEFAVCSRNVLQEDTKQKSYYEENVYHIIAAQFDIKNVLMAIMRKHKASTVVLQGETLGEGIQKNKYKIKGYDFYAFNLVIDGKKIDSSVAANIMQKYGIKWVPILRENFILLPTVNEMIEYADGNSVVGDTPREGLVIRDHDNTVSFKCISNAFLLHYKI